MSENKSQCLLSWILWQPLKFALILLCLGFAVMIPYEICILTLGPVAAQWTLGVLSVAAIAYSLYFLFRRLPCANLDQHSFIALENAQAFVLAMAVFVAAFAGMQAQRFLFTLAMMGTAGNVIFVALAAVLFVFYMYLIGLSLANVYAKFRRARAMNIPTWKIICSIPFGFNLVWIPGYIMPDAKRTTPVIPIHAEWYENLTRWIASRVSYTVLAFVIITLFSGFMFGTQTMLMSGIALLVFIMWAYLAGMTKFRNNIGGLYSTFAVLINIVLIVTLGWMIARAPISVPENMQINISDTMITQNN